MKGLAVMKSQIDEVDETTVKVSFEIEYDEIKPVVDDVYNRIIPNLKVPGFRNGKVPRQIVNAKVGVDYIAEEVTNAALQKFYTEYVTSSQLKAVSQAEITVIAPYKPGDEKGMQFEAVVEIRPKFELPSVENRELKVEVADVKDDEIETALQQIHAANQARNAQGDEKKATQNAPDDDFAKDLGFDDLQAFKAHLRTSLEERGQVDAIRRSADEFIAELVSQIGIKIPQKLLRDQLDLRIKRQEEADGKAIEKADRDKLQAQIEQEIAVWLYLDEYADKINADASNDEIIEYLARLAQELGVPFEQFVYESISNPGTMNVVKTEITRRKATEDMLKKMKVIDQNGKKIDLPFGKNEEKK
jgi:FKBP-type peptidyl-prolyl cis-trans isomerase (trigger factor)